MVVPPSHPRLAVRPLIAQLLSRGRLGVAQIVFVGLPTESKNALRAAYCADGKLSDAGASGDPSRACEPDESCEL